MVSVRSRPEAVLALCAQAALVELPEDNADEGEEEEEEDECWELCVRRQYISETLARH